MEKLENFTDEQLRDELKRRELEIIKAEHEELCKLNTLIEDLKLYKTLYKLSRYCNITGLHLLKDAMLVNVDISITEVDLDKFYNNRGCLKWE